MLYAQALLFIQMPETLKKEKRKPFSVSGERFGYAIYTFVLWSYMVAASNHVVH